MGDVQRKPKDVRVGLADVDEAGGNKRIYKSVQLEVRRRPFAGMMTSLVGEQDTADIQKQRRDLDRSFHLASVNAVCHLGRFVHRARSMALDRGLRW